MQAVLIPNIMWLFMISEIMTQLSHYVVQSKIYWNLFTSYINAYILKYHELFSH